MSRGPKEHAGGAPRSTVIHVSEWQESRFNVEIHGVQDFDFAALDTPEDTLKELLAGGKPIRAFIDALVRVSLCEERCETIRGMLSLMSKSKKPRMTSDQIAWISGMALRDGQDAPPADKHATSAWVPPCYGAATDLADKHATDLAKKNGVSKQAFCQGAEKIAERLNLRPPQAQRDPRAKETFSRSNYRRHKV